MAESRASRLPHGRDGRPLRARHRLVVAGLLLAAFGAGVGPALSHLSTGASAGGPQSAPSTTSYVAPAVAGPAQGASPYIVPRVTELRVAPAAYQRPAAAHAVAAPAVAAPAVVSPAVLPAAPSPTPTPAPKDGEVKLSVDGGSAGRNQAVSIILMMTVLSVAPSLLLLCTSFTKIAIVLSLTRNALGTPTIPPNQVLVGLALFLSLFVMSPVISQMNDKGVQPYLANKIDLDVAIERGGEPLRVFMADHTGDTELQTMIKMSKSQQPKNKADTEFTTLIPAFILSELKAAFIIGFVIFIPFLIVDLVVSSVLMSMGMMMLPPVMISLPFKLLLFVMVDGWSLITTALVTSYR